MADPGIYSEADVLALLDGLLAPRGSDWWDGFYETRTRPCPFFADTADESLAGWVGDGTIRPGRALDLGCGNGRNAIYLARHGFAVDAVDHSRTAIDWATERALAAGVAVQWQCRSVFDGAGPGGAYDLVYDSGCFHHLAPHRRRTYVDLVTAALKPGGCFGLTCFRPEGGSGYTDHEVYERRSLGGGLGYTEDGLRAVWSHGLQVTQLRQMRHPAPDSGLFGEDFLWALLAHKPR